MNRLAQFTGAKAIRTVPFLPRIWGTSVIAKDSAIVSVTPVTLYVTIELNLHAPAFE
jgi:hypothetical protein